MKRKIISGILGLIIILIIVITSYKFNNKEDNNLTTIRLAEVTHSAFYAPMYVAIEQGYFKEVGINIDLILTSGADKVATAVIGGDVEIGFAGPESAIYVYKGGEEDYLVTFAGLTKRDGQFIVARKQIDNFTLNDLVGKEVLTGRLGGMPMLNFINALNNENINQLSVNMNSSVEFAALSGSFIAGVGDFVNLFEPNATNLEKEGLGYIVGNVGTYSGVMPYTAFYTKKSFIDNNKDTITKFTKAINKGLQFIKNNSSEEIAKAIINQFPEITLTDLTKIVDNYKKYDSWLENPFITEESYKNLEDIMIKNNLLDSYVPYELLVNNFYNE